MPTVIAFIEQARQLGLKSHYFPCGQVAHLVEVVNEMRPDAFHLEEYAGIDIVELRKRLDPEIILYASIHALEILQKGPIEAIEKETKRQIDACIATGPFVAAVGTEVTKHTPPEHVDAMIRTAHAYASD